MLVAEFGDNGGHYVYHRFTGAKGMLQRAGRFTDAGPKVLTTRPADGIAASNLGYRFGHSIEGSISPVQTYGKNALID
jgi:hypothetical protein